jgi:hypothetical protein
MFANRENLRDVAVMDAKPTSQSSDLILSGWVVKFPSFDLPLHLLDQSKRSPQSPLILIEVDEPTFIMAQVSAQRLAERAEARNGFGVIEIEVHNHRTFTVRTINVIRLSYRPQALSDLGYAGLT